MIDEVFMVGGPVDGKRFAVPKNAERVHISDMQGQVYTYERLHPDPPLPLIRQFKYVGEMSRDKFEGLTSPHR
jgi:hypothetical protein